MHGHNSVNRTHYRWIIVGLIFFITLVNCIDRSAISFVITPLKKEFNFNDTQIGMILSIFGLGYVFLTGLGGFLVDKWGSRLIWSLASIAWSLSLGFFGFAGSFIGFLTLRFFLGATEGPHFPAMTRTIADWLPSTERAKALSLALTAIPFSSVISGPLISYLVAEFGWRAMFFIMSLLGIAWAIVWYIFFRNHPQDSSHTNEAERELIRSSYRIEAQRKKDESLSWRYVLTHPTLIANNAAYFTFGYILFFATLWLPEYFLSQHQLSLKSTGWYLTIPWITGVIFLKTGGFISDFLYKKTHNKRIARSYLICISQFFSAICFFCLSWTHTLELSIFFLSFGLGFGFMSQPAFFSVNIDIAKGASGFAQGISSTCLSLAAIIAPLLSGWLIDLTGNYQSIFLSIFTLTSLSVVLVIFFHHPDSKINKIW